MTKPIQSTFSGKGISNMERKFNIPAVAVSVIALLLSFFGFSVEAIAAGALGLFMTLKKKDTHLIKLPIFLSILAITGSIIFIIINIIICVKYNSTNSYWLYSLLFGSP